MKLKKLKHKKIFRISSIVFLLIILISGIFSLLRVREITMPSLFQPASETRLVMSMEGFTFTQSEKGQITWRMTAESADLYENKKARLREIEIVYTNAEKRKAVLRGEHGRMDTASGNATILRGSKDVRIVTSDGYLLTTDSLKWKADERVVHTKDPFKLLGREIYLEGRGVTADVEDHTVVVENNVKAVLQE